MILRHALRRTPASLCAPSAPLFLRRALRALATSAAPAPAPAPAPPPAPAPAPAAWLVEAAPRALQPYLRLARVDRPVGTYLVLLPALSGLALAAPPGALPDPALAALFAAGALLMRGAGCTVNDMWDRRFDAAVTRTAGRPLASGELGLPAAAAFLAAQLGAGLWCLLQLNLATGALGVACLPLVALYPALKRVTHLPQVALGLAMNWGALMGATATLGGASGGIVAGLAAAPLPPPAPLLQALGAFGSLGSASASGGGGGGGGAGAAATATLAESLHHCLLATPQAAAVLPLYLGCAAWTVVYDTLYAHQDREEDRALRLKSTALLLGVEGSRPALLAGAAAAGAGWLCAGHLAGLGAPFVVGAGAATAHLAWQVATADWGDRANLGARFVSNQWTGALLLAGIVGGKLLA
jgi:4-hydroxybenzoate polyprenyltransferase